LILSTACVLACILSHNCHRLISVSCKPVLSAIIIIIIIIKNLIDRWSVRL